MLYSTRNQFPRLVNPISTALVRKIASLGTLEGPLVKQFYALVQNLPGSLVAEIDNHIFSLDSIVNHLVSSNHIFSVDITYSTFTDPHIFF